MSEIHVVSWQEHGNKRWFKPFQFGFAARDHVAALGLHEIPKAIMSLPVAFAKTEESYIPVAVQGFTAGQNLLVTKNGQWVADYIPLVYRCQPFRLAKNAEGQFVLCVMPDADLIGDGPAGIRFFDDERKLTEEAGKVAQQLMQFENERLTTTTACKLLAEHGVIEPWPLSVQHGTEVRNTEGLFRINEMALNQLSNEALGVLRNCGGLAISYGQLFSMQHIHQLGSAAQRTAWSNKNIDGGARVAGLNIGDDNGILSFENL